MKKIVFLNIAFAVSLMMLCVVMMAQAQRIHVDHKFWDGERPSTKVTTSLSCLPESPKGGERGVAVAVMRSS